MIDVQAVLEGKRLPLSRLLSQIENDTTVGQEGLADIFPHTGKAHLIGITGAPGTGKSSLVNQLALHYRDPEYGVPKKVAIVAVDPSSPFTGGAVLGDRIRMSALSGDKDVFIRSMASRGTLGGLAKATAGVVQAFDAAGYDLILIETVGAGQAEVDIARLAHTTLVVEAPGLGDDVQAIKAGILEIADILVINKADRPGADNAERALKSMLALAHPVRRVFQHHGETEIIEGGDEIEEPMWISPIQRTVAIDATGVPELLKLIADHRTHLENTGDLERRERARLAAELDMRLQYALMSQWRDQVANGKYDALLNKVVNRKVSPQQAVKELVKGAK